MKNSIIFSAPKAEYGYIGWPSIARMEDGTLVVAASAGRYKHVCPWGRTFMWKSTDEGEHWSAGEVINNTPLDDRDAGVVALPGNKIAVTWFTENTMDHEKGYIAQEYTPEMFAKYRKCMDNLDDEARAKWIGSWVRVSPDTRQWGEICRAPVNAPHGFIVLKDGSWFYLGRGWDIDMTLFQAKREDNPITAARSTDNGRSWEILGTVPPPEGVDKTGFHEPHAIELADGTILGAIRGEVNGLTTYFSSSMDGGHTWETMHSPIAGSPPHFLLHSSGRIICTYGYREKPFGIRAAISENNGKSWRTDIILRDDGIDWDLGYPSSVELSNGDILTIYYMKAGNDVTDNTSLLATRWSLNEI